MDAKSAKDLSHPVKDPMIPEIGHFALILALLLALTQGVLPIVGAARGVRSPFGALAGSLKGIGSEMNT